MGLLRDVLKEIKPKEKNNEIISFLGRFENMVKKEGIKAEVFAGGSFAKDTF